MNKSNFDREFFFNILPFLIVILSSTISFKLNSIGALGGGEVAFVNDPRRLIILGTAYSLAVVILLGNIQYSLDLVRKQWVYVSLLFYVLVSMMWSDNPVKVVIGFGHFFGVYLSVLAAINCFRKDRELTLFILSLVFSFTLLLSIFISVTNPAVGVHFVEGRWQGVAGNPNTLGAICIIAMWVNTVLFYLTSSNIKRISVIIGGVFSVVALIGARSMTSVLVTFIMVLGVYILIKIEYKSKITKIFIFISLSSMVIAALLIMYIIFPEKLTIDSALGSIGKDSTFTGRTAIWEVAFMLIKEKPILGFSFDSLLSAFNFLGYQITQFHNGYLDYMTRGGAVGITWFVFLVIGAFMTIKRTLLLDYKYSVAVLGLVFSILTHNLAEASIMRGSHMLWTMFIFALSSLYSIELDYKNCVNSENKTPTRGCKYESVSLR